MNTEALTAAEAPTTWRYAKFTYVTVVTCWVVYALLSLFAPSSSNVRFQMSDIQLLALRVSIIIPIHLIWLVATRSAINFKHYASMIRNGREAPGINKIANGLFWTLAYLIFITLTGAIMPFFVHAKYFDILVIARDHVAPLFALIAFWVLYRGSQELKKVADFTTWTRGTFWALFGFAIFAFLFVLEFATSTTPGTGVSRTALSILPHETLLFTLIMPYTLGWFLGILAIINISKFAHQVKGTLYRQALQNLVGGIAAVVFFVMAYQVIIFAARYLTNISLGLTLLLVYAIVILYGLGFFFIRMGAKKLMRIEAVQ